MIRSSRTRSRRLGRIFRRMKPPGAEIVLSETQFRAELKKEIYRSDRRESGRELGLIWIKPKSNKVSIDPVKLFESPEFGQTLGRLRITDSIGWYQGSLAVLLPESGRDGTLVLANQIIELLSVSWDVVAEVSTYPMDDELISVAYEIRGLSSETPDDDSNVESGDDFFNDERHDSAHRKLFKPHTTKFSTNDDSHSRESGNDFWSSGATVVAEPRVDRSRQRRSERVAANFRVIEKQRRFLPSVATPIWKRAIDIAGAGLGLVMLSPVLVSAAVMIKATSKGPVFFRQVREGKDGKQFGILKLRTMVVNAEELQERLREQSEQDGPAFKLTNDPRVTTIGRYLRKSCVDELPQLWNILKGDMSLVGPRPLPVEESLACTAWQRARLTVLPGLTCTWQAYGGRDVKFAQWMQMDLDYIERRSLKFDLKLIFDTAYKAILHRGSV